MNDVKIETAVYDMEGLPHWHANPKPKKGGIHKSTASKSDNKNMLSHCLTVYHDVNTTLIAVHDILLSWLMDKMVTFTLVLLFLFLFFPHFADIFFKILLP